MDIVEMLRHPNPGDLPVLKSELLEKAATAIEQLRKDKAILRAGLEWIVENVSLVKEPLAVSRAQTALNNTHEWYEEMEVKESIRYPSDLRETYRRGVNVGREQMKIEFIEWMVEHGYPVSAIESNLYHPQSWHRLLDDLVLMAQEEGRQNGTD